MSRMRASGFLIVGLSVLPLAAHARTFAQIVNGSIVPLGNTIIALLYSLCFLFFLIGMVQFFFSHSAEQRKKGRDFAIYGIAAIAILFVVWGLVRFLVGIISSFNT